MIIQAASELDSELAIAQVDCLMPPAWVAEMLGREPRLARTMERDGLRVDVLDAEAASWLQIVLPGALHLSAKEFQSEVTQVYRLLREQLRLCRARHPLRFWNFVPEIHRSSRDGRVRYEVFNAGRSAAFAEWYATCEFGARMIAASGVGVRDEDFVVQVLASVGKGRGVENPRQLPAWRYSRRYGPVPPSFARATLAPRRNGSRSELMIVAGTASVVGEDSLHVGDFQRQVDETCLNLRSLLASAGSVRAGLEAFEELRVYLVRDEHRPLLIDLLRERFPRLRRLEIMPADICRADLLVEIEGVVELPDRLPKKATKEKESNA